MSVYPSDAPLPKFNVVTVQGCPTTEGIIFLRFEASISNYAELANWWNWSDYSTKQLTFRWTETGGTWISFIGGIRIHHEAGEDARISESYWGKWVTLALKDCIIPNLGTFSEPLYFCDVFIPFPSDLPVGVWSDLQFTVSPPIPEASWMVIIPLAIFGIGALAYWYLKKRK